MEIIALLLSYFVKRDSCDFPVEDHCNLIGIKAVELKIAGMFCLYLKGLLQSIITSWLTLFVPLLLKEQKERIVLGRQTFSGCYDNDYITYIVEFAC